MTDSGSAGDRDADRSPNATGGDGRSGSSEPTSHRSGSSEPTSHRSGSSEPTSHRSGSSEPTSHRSAQGDPGRYDPVTVFSEGDLDLRTGADDCYKCTACDLSCPVAAVDDDFPGPKFQGPEQWRLTRKHDRDIDESITKCSNCMRCDAACPAGVPLSQMHNEARAEYVSAHVSPVSREYLRNRLLSNYRLLAHLGSKTPRLTNAVLNTGPIRWIVERLLGITAERELPAFSTQTFREWWSDRGGVAASRERARASRDRPNAAEEPSDGQATPSPKRVAYFHGCYTNYHTPSVGRATVRVFEHFGYEVLVPPQRCSGTPMFANGMLADARREAETNVAELGAAIADGADVIASCTSCSLSLRQEYPELFDVDGVYDVASNTYEAIEYLRINEDLSGALAAASVDEPGMVYHAPCHARTQGLDHQTRELFRDVDGIRIEDAGDSCSGISGTYGFKTETYETSMAIGADMFDHMEAATGTVGLTECPTCAMQMEHGTGYEIRHPMEVLASALLD